MSRRAARRLLLTVLAAALGAAPLAVTAPAQAGQVGVTVSVKGSGLVRVVEGSLEDGGSTVCDKTGNLDDRVLHQCDRVRNEEPLEAWVWLRPELAQNASYGWQFAGWEGCDETRYRDGATECAVHSAAFGSVERSPVAVFDDTVAPWPTLAAPQQLAPGQFRFAWTASEGGVSAECRFDFVVQPCGSPVTWTYGPGSHLFQVQLTDASGNVGLSYGHTVTVVDTVLTEVPPALTRNTTATIRFETPGGTGAQCELDSQPVSCGEGGTVQLTGLTDGEHTFRVQGTNGDVVDPVPAQATWTVDSSAPVTTIDAATVEGTTAELVFRSAGASSTSCRLVFGDQASGWAPCVSPVTYVNLVPRAYTFEVRGTDAAGNVEQSYPTRGFTITGGGAGNPGNPGNPGRPVDRTPPALRLDGGPSHGTISLAPARFTLAASEPARFGCTLDGRALPCAAGPLALPGLAPGGHVLTVRATDAAGNTGRNAVVRTWTVPTPATALRGRGWRAKPVRGSYAGRVLQATRKGATVQHRVTRATRIGLVVSTGKRYGSVRVYAGKRLLRTIRTAGRPSTRRIVEIPLATAYSGRVRIVTTSARTVRLEGLAAVTR